MNDVLAAGVRSRIAIEPSFKIKSSINEQFEWQVLVSLEDGREQVILFKDEPFNPDSRFFSFKRKFTPYHRDKNSSDNIIIGKTEKINSALRLISFSLENKSIELTFSHNIKSESITINQFIFTPIFEIVRIENSSQASIKLEADSDFEQGVNYQLAINNIEDLADNALDTSFNFFVPFRPSVGDLIINEILFNPKDNGADFVEMINVSDNELSIENLYISNEMRMEEESFEIQSIMPGEIFVLTDDKKNIISSFPNHESSFIHEQPIPTFNNNEGNVSIVMKESGNRVLLDFFDYSKKLHHPLIDDENGVSLERINIERPAAETENWTSASSISGFGTPGLPNSNTFKSKTNSVGIKVLNKVFSPNNSGENRLAKVSYTANPQSIGNVTVHDLYGRVVNSIWRNETIDTEGVIVWDGTNNAGEIEPIGVYVIVIEIFSLVGDVHRFKQEVVLAGFLD